jgi:hypothetical protein
MLNAQKETTKSGKHASITTLERGSWFNHKNGIPMCGLKLKFSQK